MTTELASAQRAWVSEFAAHGATSEQAYNDLDRQLGDGDFGTNLAMAGRGVQARLAETDAAPFEALAAVFLDDIGGSSGPLFGLLFGNIERATADELTVATLAAGTRAGRDAIVRVGHAEVGDKTLIDALTPVVDVLDGTTGDDLAVALSAASAAGEAGAEKTREFRARRGRASYVGDRAIGAIDPGALALARFFQIGAAAVASYSDSKKGRTHP